MTATSASPRIYTDIYFAAYTAQPVLDFDCFSEQCGVKVINYSHLYQSAPKRPSQYFQDEPNLAALPNAYFVLPHSCESYEQHTGKAKLTTIHSQNLARSLRERHLPSLFSLEGDVWERRREEQSADTI